MAEGRTFEHACVRHKNMLVVIAAVCMNLILWLCETLMVVVVCTNLIICELLCMIVAGCSVLLY